MTDKDAAQPLSDHTRHERTWLLGANVLLFAMVHAHLVPQEIAAFGLRSAAIDPAALISLVQVVVAYLGCAFVLAAWADFTAWNAGVGFLRDRKLARLKFYGDQVKSRVRTELAMHEATIGKAEMDRIVESVSKENFKELDQAFASGWKNFSKAYRWRAWYETVVPVVLTVANLAWAAFPSCGV